MIPDTKRNISSAFIEGKEKKRKCKDIIKTNIQGCIAGINLPMKGKSSQEYQKNHMQSIKNDRSSNVHVKISLPEQKKMEDWFCDKDHQLCLSKENTAKCMV